MAARSSEVFSKGFLLTIPSVCAECGESSGICDRCYDMEKSCGDTSHILTRYVIYKGEKSIRKALTEKDCCQFCKSALGTGTFYCKSSLESSRTLSHAAGKNLPS